MFLFRLRGLFIKRKLEQELADEIQSHLEMQIEDNQRRGMTPDEARYAALRRFGGVDQVKEIYRDRRGLAFVETFLRDLRCYDVVRLSPPSQYCRWGSASARTQPYSRSWTPYS
jgi:hypothetical protein